MHIADKSPGGINKGALRTFDFESIGKSTYIVYCGNQFTSEVSGINFGTAYDRN